MKTRIISAAVAIVLLAAILYLGSTAVGIAVFVLAVVGVFEFYRALSKSGYKPVYALGMAACLPLLYPAFSDSIADITQNAGLIIGIPTFLLTVVLLCILIFSDGKYKVADISVTLFGAFYVAFLISFITLTRKLDNGYLYIWMIFIGALMTDTFAYFTGVAIGKTKILPKVSPKKTLEGSIGGIIGCIFVMMLFGYYFRDVLGIQLYHFAILGTICSVVSQLGDWAASAIKRQAGIKDYGKIMPGHGGVLDRVDSVLFVAPVVYIYLTLFV